MSGSPPPEFAFSPLLDDEVVERAIIADLEADLGRAHCVLLVGPYEVGKSYVARKIAQRFGPGASVLIASDPDHECGLTASMLRGSRGRLIVIDEIHAAPAALDAIRLELECWARDHMPIGQFLLLSSRPLEAISLVEAKLATRVEVRSLTPIGMSDLASARAFLQPFAALSAIADFGDTEPIARRNSEISGDTLWLRGGFQKASLPTMRRALLGGNATLLAFATAALTTENTALALPRSENCSPSSLLIRVSSARSKEQPRKIMSIISASSV